jgi:hypothetical protein
MVLGQRSVRAVWVVGRYDPAAGSPGSSSGDCSAATIRQTEAAIRVNADCRNRIDPVGKSTSNENGAGAIAPRFLVLGKEK